MIGSSPGRIHQCGNLSFVVPPGFAQAAHDLLAAIERMVLVELPFTFQRFASYTLSRDSSATCREQASRRGEVDVGDQQAFLTVGLIAEKRPIRASDRRCGR